MAIDPSIALNVKPIELANPLAQYGMLAQIQNAQNQNALSQYQLGAAQRAEQKDIARTNALTQAGTDDTAIANALLKTGDLEGYSKFVKSRNDAQKTESDLFDSSMKQIRDAWGRVKTPEQALAIHDATHRNLIIGRRLAAMGLTEEMGRNQILEAAKNPNTFADFINRAQLGAEKFMELNKPVTTVIDQSGQKVMVQRPGLSTAAPTTVGTYKDVPLPADVAEQQKELKKAGATTVGITNINSPTGKSLSEPVGKRVEASLSKAEGATGMRVNANLVQEALNSGKVIAGPMAEARTTIAQVLNMAGANNRDQLQNSLAVAKGLAGLTLESRGELKGQGQITDPETKLLEKARSGDTSLTLDELQQVVNISNRMSNRLWQNHQNLLKTMENDPAAAGSIQYYRPTSGLDEIVAPSAARAQTPQNPARPSLDSIFSPRRP